jgi:hypothetical protein
MARLPRPCPAGSPGAVEPGRPGEVTDVAVLVGPDEGNAAARHQQSQAVLTCNSAPATPPDRPTASRDIEPDARTSERTLSA